MRAHTQASWLSKAIITAQSNLALDQGFSFSLFPLNLGSAAADSVGLFRFELSLEVVQMLVEQPRADLHCTTIGAWNRHKCQIPANPPQERFLPTFFLPSPPRNTCTDRDQPAKLTSVRAHVGAGRQAQLPALASPSHRVLRHASWHICNTAGPNWPPRLKLLVSLFCLDAFGFLTYVQLFPR